MPGTRPHAITNRLRNGPSTNLVVDMEVLSRVEARDLIAVAVEHERLAPARLTDALLGRLTPARVVVGWIDVGVEAVLARRVAVPARRRLRVDQRDLHDRL